MVSVYTGDHYNQAPIVVVKYTQAASYTQVPIVPRGLLYRGDEQYTGGQLGG
jgi:hypothetical protein